MLKTVQGRIWTNQNYAKTFCNIKLYRKHNGGYNDSKNIMQYKNISFQQVACSEHTIYMSSNHSIEIMWYIAHTVWNNTHLQ